MKRRTALRKGPTSSNKLESANLVEATQRALLNLLPALAVDNLRGLSFPSS